MTLTRRTLLQGVSAFAVPSLSKAVALAATTGKFVLTNAGWTDLGVGPLLLRLGGDGVYAIGDTTPAIPLGEGFTIRAGRSVRVMTPSHVWAMARGGAGVSAYVAPISSGAAPPPTSVWSAADAAATAMTLTNGGLTVTNPGGGYDSIRGTQSKSSGKLYVEFKNSAATNGYDVFGVAGSSFNPTGILGSSNYSVGIRPVDAGGGLDSAASGTNYPITSVVIGSTDVWAFAIDFGTGNLWIAQNNVWFGSGNPGTGANPLLTLLVGTIGPMFPAMALASGMGTWTLQPTAASQKYLPPPGFQAWDGGPVTPSTSVWSAADAAANSMTLSNGGLTVTSSGAGGYQTVRGTLSQTAGKFYIEFNMSGGSVDGGIGDPEFGIATSGFSPLDYIGHNPISAGTFSGASGSLAPVNPSGDFTSNYAVGGIFSVINDVWAIAVDLTAGKYWLAKNNVWFGSGNPATGANPMIAIVGAGLGQPYFPAMALRNGASFTGVWTLQPTAASQKYAPPAGFTPWG